MTTYSDVANEVTPDLFDAIDDVFEKELPIEHLSYRKIKNRFTNFMINHSLAKAEMDLCRLIVSQITRKDEVKVKWGAELCSVLCLQSANLASYLFRTLYEMFVKALKNEKFSLATRISCATAIGNLACFGTNILSHILVICRDLKSLFPDVYKVEPKDDETNKDISKFYVTIIRLYSMMVSVMVAQDATNKYTTENLFQRFNNLLNNDDLNIRLAVAKLICLFLEKGRITDYKFFSSSIPNMISQMDSLEIDESKNEHVDLDAFKYEFNECKDYLKDDEFPEAEYVFSDEVVSLDNWTKYLQFEAIAFEFETYVLDMHFKYNRLLRYIFMMGNPRDPKTYYDHRRCMRCTAAKFTKIHEDRLHHSYHEVQKRIETRDNYVPDIRVSRDPHCRKSGF